MNRSIKVCLTGACGNIAYSLYIPLCSGMILGENVQIDLRLVDVSSKYNELKIIREQLDDCCYKNVKSISIYDERDQQKPFQDIDLAIFLGGMARKPGMHKKEVFEINAEIFQTEGRYLQMVAKVTCKCLVIANPTCTNCMILADNAPKIPKENFTALTRLDYNRFLGQVSKLFKCKPTALKNLILWGNHSRKQYLDTHLIQVNNVDHASVLEKLKEIDLKSIEKIMYERGGFILEKSNGNSYMSATTAIIDHLKDWLLGSDKIVSMGVYLTKQIYGIPAGICFSLPTRCLANGKYEIISNIDLNEQQRSRILQSKQELLKQKSIVEQFDKPNSN